MEDVDKRRNKDSEEGKEWFYTCLQLLRAFDAPALGVWVKQLHLTLPSHYLAVFSRNLV